MPSIDTIDGDALYSDLLATIREDMPDRPLIFGIRSGGEIIARRLHEDLGLDEAPSFIDISFYRDDFSTIGLNPHVGGSEFNADIEGRDVLLVDDVVHSGRTVRAALNELFDHGRPRRVRLAALASRSGHALPIRADYVGHHFDLEAGLHLDLIGGEDGHALSLNVVDGR